MGNSLDLRAMTRRLDGHVTASIKKCRRIQASEIYLHLYKSLPTEKKKTKKEKKYRSELLIVQKYLDLLLPTLDTPDRRDT